MNLAEQTSVEYDIEYFGHMSKNGTAGSYGILIFILLRILDIDYQIFLI